MKGSFYFMNRYANIDCPICSKPLDDGASVVVCPECGAPYHTDCYKQEGKCIFDELHQNHETWTAPIKEEKYDGAITLRCSRCGTANPSTGIFCQVCGNQLSNSESQDTINQPQGFGGRGFIPPGMPLNPFTTPFGGVSPDEDIDSIPAKDIAIFVGKNSHYYLPRFKQMSQTDGKARSINWAAFVFTGGFFLYRKMYLMGIILIIINAVLSLPYALLMFSTLNSVSSLDVTSSLFNVETLTTLNMISSFISISLRMFCGFFANNMYKKHTYSKINKIKSETEGQGNDIYLEQLAKRGSVALKLITVLLVGYIALTILSTYSLLLIGI